MIWRTGYETIIVDISRISFYEPCNTAGFFILCLMNYRVRKFLKAIAIIVLVYLFVGVVLFFVQDLLLFHPVPLSKDHKFQFSIPFKEINIPAPPNRNLSIVQFYPDSPSKGIVLYFHGNRQNIERYSNYAYLFIKHGYEVWMIDYPGFGKSTGKRTEQAMYHDAMLLYKMAVQQNNPQNIIIYGKSIGTGIATQLASVADSRQLILETPYYSIEALAKHYFPFYPVVVLTKYHFPINKYLEDVRVPVTAFHGTDDEVIPYKHAKKLSARHKNFKLVTVQNAKHNNLIDYDPFTNNLDSLLKN